MRLAASTWPWLFGLVVIAACERAGCGADYLAEATQTSAQVTRDFSSAMGQWQSCEAGDRFELGDGLHTGEGAMALLAMQPSGSVQVEENTTIRFERGDTGDARRLSLESGAVTVETEVTDLEVLSADSITRVERGSRVEFERSEDGGATVHVRAGRAVIEAEGAERVVKAGQRIDLEVGGAVLEVSEDDPAEETAPEEEPESAKSAALPALPVGQAFEVRLREGENATIHDPHPPTSVAFSLPCERGGAVEMARGNGSFGFREGRGREHVSVQLPVGFFRYRVRCLNPKGELEAPSAGGTLRVVADAATRRLPAKAQRVRMDADGRNYRIQYSNRLPLFTFTWRDAPPADMYVLHVEQPNGRGLIRRRSQEAEVNLREGALGEGEYHYWFETDQDESSKRTTLDVTFQNQGRTAYLARSLEASESPGSVSLRGGALAQSEVTVEGTPVPLDAQGRFNTDIPTPETGHLSVRVAHPATGVHYYLRRVP